MLWEGRLEVSRWRTVLGPVMCQEPRAVHRRCWGGLECRWMGLARDRHLLGDSVPGKLVLSPMEGRDHPWRAADRQKKWSRTEPWRRSRLTGRQEQEERFKRRAYTGLRE